MRRKFTQPGTKRVLCRFLWLPLEIDNELRWLEWACWIEKHYIGCYTGRHRWLPIEWVEGEQ